MIIAISRSAVPRMFSYCLNRWRNIRRPWISCSWKQWDLMESKRPSVPHTNLKSRHHMSRWLRPIWRMWRICRVRGCMMCGWRSWPIWAAASTRISTMRFCSLRPTQSRAIPRLVLTSRTSSNRRSISLFWSDRCRLRKQMTAWWHLSRMKNSFQASNLSESRVEIIH